MDLGNGSPARVFSRDEIMKKQRGGKRAGSGRKRTGPIKVKKTIAMPVDDWAEFDERRGEITRGTYIMQLLGL